MSVSLRRAAYQISTVMRLGGTAPQHDSGTEELAAVKLAAAHYVEKAYQILDGSIPPVIPPGEGEGGGERGGGGMSQSNDDATSSAAATAALKQQTERLKAARKELGALREESKSIHSTKTTSTIPPSSRLISLVLTHSRSPRGELAVANQSKSLDVSAFDPNASVCCDWAIGKRASKEVLGKLRALEGSLKSHSVLQCVCLLLL